MKLLQYIFLIAVSLPVSNVSRQQEWYPLPQDSSIVGSWKYIGRSGGFMGANFRADPTKKTYIQLKDSTYTCMMNGLKYCGIYKIWLHKTDSDQQSLLMFDSSRVNNKVSRKEDTLILTQQTPEGMSFWYIPCDTSFSSCEN